MGAYDDGKLKQALGYPKFKAQPSILVLDTGYLLVRDVAETAEDLGWKVARLPTKREGNAEGSFIADLLKALLVHRPNFVITINHLGLDEKAVLENLLFDLGIPLASWFVDHPLPILGASSGNPGAHTQIFCFERTALSWLTKKGYADPLYLPLGSHQRYYAPEKVDKALAASLACPLSFVGNSWWTKAYAEPRAWAQRAAREIRRRLTVNRHTLNHEVMDRIEDLPLELPRPTDRSFALHVALAQASVETRKRFAQSLLPVGLTIHGDPYWKKLVPQARPKPCLDYERSVPALFAGSEINANVTAEQMPTAVNQRVWDVPAVGAFLLTDAQEDALEYFEEDREIVVYRSFEEAADKARYYLAHVEVRRAIAARARERVSAGHTMGQRLGKIHDIMASRFG